ncbi:MAG: hypothetical protein WCJ30_28545 [Deltaproteobacteria bacterium]
MPEIDAGPAPHRARAPPGSVTTTWTTRSYEFTSFWSVATAGAHESNSVVPIDMDAARAGSGLINPAQSSAPMSGWRPIRIVSW